MSFQAHILVVDAHAEIRRSVTRYLEKIGLRATGVSDAKEMDAQLALDASDLIVLDIMMPRMSGYQVCRWMKSREETRAIPVIMVTALGEVGDVERAVDHGADDFLTKPVERVELLTRVRNLLKVGRLQSDLENTLRELKRLRGED